MKIAVATLDDKTIASHFRQSDRFVVIDLQGESVVGTETREMRRPEESHDHSDTIQALADCCAVICGGMGGRVAEALSRYGIEPVVALDCDQTPEHAARQFVAGRLQRGTPHACCCEH